MDLTLFIIAFRLFLSLASMLLVCLEGMKSSIGEISHLFHIRKGEPLGALCSKMLIESEPIGLGKAGQ